MLSWTTVRMPGWWNITNNRWDRDKICVCTRTGDVAWAIIALLSLYRETHENIEIWKERVAKIERNLE